MDGNRFYEKILEFFDRLYYDYKKTESIYLIVPNKDSFIIKDSGYLKSYCYKENVRLGSLLQFLITKVLIRKFNFNNYDIVINNIPRKSDNDISIKRIDICNSLKEQQKQIDKAISNSLQDNINQKEHDVLIIVNNKQAMYEKLKSNSIVEEHIERNNYKIVFTVDIQKEIQISLAKKSDALDILEDVKKEIYKFMEGKI